VVTAQDKALATICIERGLLDDAAIERARAAHAEQSEPPPLGNLLVDRGFLEPKVAAGLIRELALATFLCPQCERVWSYEALSSLARYRCDRCDERLVRRSSRQPGAKTTARRAATDATELDRARVSSGRLVALPPVKNTAASFRTPGTSRFGPVDAADPAPTSAPASGTSQTRPQARLLGPYELQSELGRGAMGVVYLARHATLGRLCAVKVLIGGALADAEAVERFRRESALASRVQHPNVVAVYDVGFANGVYFYVMEHCPGRTLKTLLKEREKLPSEEAARLAAQVARGLAAAHVAGIVHRDVKPANIILEEGTTRPRITDFGLARDSTQTKDALTRTGDLVGTPSYMSPEQLVGRRGIDARSDVYALGVLLYEMLSGRRPFLAATTAELSAKVLTEEPRPLRSVAPEVPPPLEAIVAKAMARAPEGRYPTAAEVADDLERFLSGEPVHARPERGLARIWRRSKRKVAFALAVLAAAGGATAIVLAHNAAREHRDLVSRAVEGAQGLERRAKLGEAYEELVAAFSELRARAPEEARAAVDLAWARILERRDRSDAALEVVAPYADAKDSTDEPRRISAEARFAKGDATRAEPLLASLERGSDRVLADWARARRALAAMSALASDVRERIVQGSDEPSLRVVAELERRSAHEAEAAKLLDRVLALASDDARAHLARAALQRGRLDPARLRSDADHDARAHVEAFFRLAGPDGGRSGEAFYERARSELAERLYSEAAFDLDAALELGFDTVDANEARSWFQDEKARSCAARARELDPASDKSHALELRDRLDLAAAATPDVKRRLDARAALAQAPARAALAAALLASARGARVERVIELFDEAAKLAPACPIVAVERARALMSRGRHAAALAAIAASRALASSDARELLLLETETCERWGRRASAEDAAQKLVELDAEGLPGILARAFLARAAAKPESVDLARKAVALAPDSAAAHRFLAEAILETGELVEAETEARAALAVEARLDVHDSYLLVSSSIPNPFGRRGPRRSDAGRRRGSESHDRDAFFKEFEGIRAAWDAFVSDFPTALHYWERGIVELRFRRGPSAGEDFEKASEVEPDSPLGEEGLGLAALVSEDEEGAVAHWRKAVAIDPRWKLPPEFEALVKREAPHALDRVRESK
jgi:hypothetical protein